MMILLKNINLFQKHQENRENPNIELELLQKVRKIQRPNINGNSKMKKKRKSILRNILRFKINAYIP